MNEEELKKEEDDLVKKIVSKIVLFDVYGDKENSKVITISEPKFFRKIFMGYLKTHGNIIKYNGYEYNREIIMNDMILNRVLDIRTKLKYQIRRDKEGDASYCNERDFLTKKESWSKEKLIDKSDIKIKLLKPKNVSNEIWKGSNDEQRIFLIKLFGGVLDSVSHDGYNKDSETNKILCDLCLEGHSKKTLATDKIEYMYKKIDQTISVCEQCFEDIQELNVKIIDFHRLYIS